MGTLITTQPDITENNLVEFDLSDAVSSSLVKTQISLKDLEASADIILLVLGQTPYTAFTNGSTIGYGDSNNRGDGAGEMGTDLPYIAFTHTVLYIGSDRNSDWQCALLSNGDVECWGFSSYYSMGGTATSYSFENRNV